MTACGGSRLPTVMIRRAVSDVFFAPSIAIARMFTVEPSGALDGTLIVNARLAACTELVNVVSYDAATPPLIRTRMVLSPTLSVAFTDMASAESDWLLPLATVTRGLMASRNGGSMTSSPLHAPRTTTAPRATSTRRAEPVVTAAGRVRAEARIGVNGIMGRRSSSVSGREAARGRLPGYVA